MKLLLVFAFCSIQSWVCSDITPEHKKLSSYQPVKGPLQSNIKILNERKLQKKVIAKQLFYEKAVHTGKTKRADLKHKNYTFFPVKKPNLNNEGYTVFPHVPENQKSIPESKYFQVFQEEQPSKPSVKRVLSPLARAKRSANKKRGHLSKKEEKALESRLPRPVHEKDAKVDARRSHHKKSHKKHKRHGKKHHKSRKHKKSDHRRNNDGKDAQKLEARSKRDSQGQGNRPSNDTRRLFGSRDATIEQFPYVVSIQKGNQHWCAGALLNPRIVITTANCVWKSVYLSKMSIRAGSRQTSQRGQRAHIQQVLKHPNWSIRKNPDNDVAMLLLDRNIRFSDTVHGADIPNRKMVPAFDDVWVTSWGSDRESRDFSTASTVTVTTVLCTGNHVSVGDFIGVSQSSASRIVHDVSLAIAALYDKYVYVQETAEKFYRIAGYPRVLGAVDGTHIRIQCPCQLIGEEYRNRKNYFSINVQCVCDAELRLMNVVARWPGSAHDATIFNNSIFRAQCESGVFGNRWLLGDSAYPNRSYLLTPLLNPVTEAEQRYNEAHIKTRNTIERTIGVWKRRFPVIALTMRLSINNILAVITATAVLHNICRNNNLSEVPTEIELPPDDNDIGSTQNTGLQDITHRTELINNYFTN